MLSFADLTNLGVPISLLALMGGLAGGWTICDVLTTRQLESLQGELSLSREQLQAARQAVPLLSDEDQKVLRQCERSRELLLQQNQKVEQLSTWNAQWSKNYQALESNCASLMSNATLIKQVAEVREQWEAASGDVIRYTSGNCGPQANDCDLVSLAQRKLKAMETKRDQLQIQMLDLQSRMACQSQR